MNEPRRSPSNQEKQRIPDNRKDNFDDVRDNWVHCVAISVEGDQIITGCYRGEADLWDAATGKKLHTFQGHTGGVVGVALSADGKHAWTASYVDGTTRLWDTKSGKELCALLSFEAGKDWLVVTPEGFFDGSQGAWKQVAFREPGTGKVLKEATRRKFYRPGLLGAFYRGEKPKP